MLRFDIWDILMWGSRDSQRQNAGLPAKNVIHVNHETYLNMVLFK
jgi:hypothetical protein